MQASKRRNERQTRSRNAAIASGVPTRAARSSSSCAQDIHRSPRRCVEPLLAAREGRSQAQPDAQVSLRGRPSFPSISFDALPRRCLRGRSAASNLTAAAKLTIPDSLLGRPILDRSLRSFRLASQRTGLSRSRPAVCVKAEPASTAADANSPSGSARSFAEIGRL